MNAPARPSAPVLAAGLLVAIASAGCAEEFAPYGRLTSARVLAVQSDPVRPATGETAQLTPLLYLPAGVELDSARWSWCPFPGAAADGYPCLVTEEDVARLAGAAADTVPPFDLGSGQTASFENSIDPDLLELLCTGTEDAPALVRCEGGFPAQIRLTVRAGGEEITAVRTLRLRFDPDSAGNENPVIEGLLAEVGGEERPLDDAATVAIPREVETVIRARVAEDQAEEYTRTGEDGEPEARRERLVLTWFVESGETAEERTGYIEDMVPLADALDNEWEPAAAEDYAPDTARLIVVVRDDREGVSWTGATVALEEAP